MTAKKDPLKLPATFGRPNRIELRQGGIEIVFHKKTEAEALEDKEYYAAVKGFKVDAEIAKSAHVQDLREALRRSENATVDNKLEALGAKRRLSKVPKFVKMIFGADE